MFIVLVGPDGVGKTSLAEHLLAVGKGRVLYFHFRPTTAQPLRPFVHLGPETPRKTAPSSGNRAIGVARMLRNVVRFWWAYLVRIRPAVRAGHLVIGDRWGYGYAASPRGVRFYGPAWLGRLATRIMPKPSLIINLTGTPTVIHERKADLEPEQIAEELRSWASLDPTRRVDVDATPALTSVADQVLRIVAGAGWSV